MESRLVIGSAQFGMNYGIANKNGKISENDIKKIILYAKDNEINTIDTAISYGDSEECIGRVGLKDWNIITKIPQVPDSCQDISSWIDRKIYNSLEKLNVKLIDAVLLHYPLQLLEAKGYEIWAALLRLKRIGLINKIGFSIYNPDELTALYDIFKPDIVQFPYNIFDRRIETSGWLNFLCKNRIETHSRSVFLQGLLLINKNERLKKFSRWSELWKSWDGFLEKQKISALQACMGFVMLNKSIDKIIVGVDSKGQLKEIIELKSISCFDELLKFSSTDEELIDPSLWNKHVN